MGRTAEDPTVEGGRLRVFDTALGGAGEAVFAGMNANVTGLAVDGRQQTANSQLMRAIRVFRGLVASFFSPMLARTRVQAPPFAFRFRLPGDLVSSRAKAGALCRGQAVILSSSW